MNTSLAPASTAIASDTTPMTYLAQQPMPSSDAVNDGRWRRWPRMLRDASARAVRAIRSLGPYVAIELFLPGGSIIALALWTYRRRRAARGDTAVPSTALMPMAGRGPCTQ